MSRPGVKQTAKSIHLPTTACYPNTQAPQQSWAQSQSRSRTHAVEAAPQARSHCSCHRSEAGRAWLCTQPCSALATSTRYDPYAVAVQQFTQPRTALPQGHCSGPEQAVRAAAEARSHAPLLPDARLVRSVSARAHSSYCRHTLLHMLHRPYLLLSICSFRDIIHSTCAWNANVWNANVSAQPCQVQAIQCGHLCHSCAM